MALYPSAPDRERDKESEAFQVLRDDATFAAGRVLFFQYFCVAAVLYLAFGYWNLQVRRGDYFAELGTMEAAARTGFAAAERADAHLREVTHA